MHHFKNHRITVIPWGIHVFDNKNGEKMEIFYVNLYHSTFVYDISDKLQGDFY